MTRVYEFDEFSLDASKLLLQRDGEVVHISPKAIELLVLLVEAGDRVVTRSEIMDRVWRDTFVEEGNINFHISNLRRALGQNGSPETQFIRTIPRKGYKFVADVRQAEPRKKFFAAARPQRRVSAGWVAVVGLIAISIAAAFGIYNSGGGQKANAVRPEVPDEAVALYKKGRLILDSRVFSEQNPAELFAQAIEIAPNYVEAHAALADVYAFEGTPEKAEDAIARARAISGDTADLMATEAFIRMFHYWDWDGAERGFLKAIAADASNAKTRHWYGVMLTLAGRFEEARAELRVARNLAPESLIIAADLGQAEYFAGDLSAAAAELEAVLRTEPRFTMARRYLSEVRERQGDETQAFEERMKAYVRPTESVIAAKKVFDTEGMRGIWQARVESGVCGADSKTPYECARAHAKLGDHAASLQHLEAALHQRAFELPYAAIDPIFEPLQGSERFQAVISTVRSGAFSVRN